MRIALVENGPIAVGIEVYDDFMSYHSGVYHHTETRDTVNRLNKWDPFKLQIMQLLWLDMVQTQKRPNPIG